MRSSAICLALALTAAPGLVGCALMSKGDLVISRYYSPEVPASPRAADAAPGGEGLKLRLGRVSAGDQLRQRIVYREAPGALAYYEERRWAEGPEAYARRALARVLFEERGLGRVISGAAPTLEIEVVAFEEIRQPKPVARVGMTAVLHDQKTVHLQQTFVVDRPFDPADDGALARAMAEALQVVVGQIADQSTSHLRAMREPALAPPCKDAAAESALAP